MLGRPTWRSDVSETANERMVGTASPTDAARESRPTNVETLRSRVAALLGVDADRIAPGDDLVGHGMDSLRVIRLASAWSREYGVEVRAADLMERPTLAAWWRHLSQAPSATSTAAEEAPVDDELEPFELAPMQQAYWIGRADTEALGGVNAHFYAELDGAGVDPVALERAVGALFARHAMLRARFLDDGRQQILAESPWPGLVVHDLRAGGADALEALRTRLTHRRLDVERGEVFDVQLSLLPDGATRMHVNIDMLVADATSFQIILSDLAHLYRRPDEELPPIGISFRRYLAWQARRRAHPRARARAYWASQLDELPGPPQLPLAVDPDRVSGQRIARRFRSLSAGECERLAELSRRHGVTISAALLAAFAEMLGAWSTEPRFLLNLPLFDREDLHEDVPKLVGDFTNLMILGVDLSEELSFAERARRLQEQMRRAAAHPEYSGLEVLRDLTRRYPGRRVAAPVVFTSAIGMGELFDAGVRATFGQPVWTSSQTPQVWLDQQVTQRDDGFFVNWDVVEELFPPGAVDAMFEVHDRILVWLLRDGADWAQPLPDLLPRSQRAIRAKVNATDGPEPADTLADGFVRVAREQPERTALVWSDGATLSYGELLARAARLAAGLAEHGVRPGALVAVTLPRGPDQIAAVLAVALAGGAYVPVGIDQPPERRRRILTRAGVRVVVADGANARGLDGFQLVTPESAGRQRPVEPVRVAPDSLAYVIFTSGSTGEPKGVEITHRAAMNTIDDVRTRFGIGADDAVLAVSSLDFDLSVFDVFGLLGVGGRVVLVDEESRRDARRWAELVRRFGVSVWNSVPALLEMLLLAGQYGGLGRTLRVALVSGDWVSVDLPGALSAQQPSCRLVALGGATEAAIWSNAYEPSSRDPRWRSIPYGYPLRGQRFRVVDARGRDRPDWVPGELWIGGRGLARGYCGDAETTRRRFVEADGERWYRTGDLGRYWEDGTLEFLGRVDHQVKVRGYRIELGEIEAVLLESPDVAAAVAVVVEHPAPFVAAAIVPRRAPDLDLLRATLAARLPSYMVPIRIVSLEALPLTANGKVDRGALESLVGEAAAATLDPGEQPKGELELALAALWRDLLGVPRVGRNDTFFALGGDSLLATRLLNAVRLRFGRDVSLRQFLAAPSVRELCLLLGEDEAYEEGVL
jgi:amino acid adenylation domain-containing protein